MRNRLPFRGTGVVLLALTTCTLAGMTACSRSETPTQPATPETTTASRASAGSFGSLTGVCGPGSARGKTARGVTDTSIDITTLADPGNTLLPGLEQEFFDTGDAFVKWCNDAGGINGRKIVLHKRDAALFNGAARILDACRTDFMSVGGGTVLDTATVQPRIACGLGEIPAYHASPEAATAPLQVQPNPAPPTQYNVGAQRALAQTDPALGQHIGILVDNEASLVPVAKRIQTALDRSGLKVTDFQTFPNSVANWRPFVELSRQRGTKLLTFQGVPSWSALFTSMQDVGYVPQAMLQSIDGYEHGFQQAVAAAPSTPKIWDSLTFLPFELADQSPVVKQAVDLLTTTSAREKLSGYSAFSLTAWLLWAKSATECGSNLTVQCVLQKAGSHQRWDAGGFFAPVNTDPAHASYSTCFLLVQVTKQGFGYDRAATRPTDGYFNCDSKNLVTDLPTH